MTCDVAGAERRAERAENRVERSGERESQKNNGAEIGWSAVRLFRRSRFAHMLCLSAQCWVSNYLLGPSKL